MLCSSCGKQIPDQSVFCMFCGTNVKAVQATSQPLNTRPPINVSQISFRFTGPVTLLKKGQVGRDGFRIRFRLVDDKGEPTAYNGTVQVKIVVYQEYSIYREWRDRLKTQMSFPVSVADFRPGEDGPYYEYEQRTKIGGLNIDDGYYTEAEIELYFTPQGTTQKLYRAVKLSIDPQAP